jgi:hypothetical protein
MVLQRNDEIQKKMRALIDGTEVHSSRLLQTSNVYIPEKSIVNILIRYSLFKWQNLVICSVQYPYRRSDAPTNSVLIVLLFHL